MSEVKHLRSRDGGLGHSAAQARPAEAKPAEARQRQLLCAASAEILPEIWGDQCTLAPQVGSVELERLPGVLHLGSCSDEPSTDTEAT